MATYSHQRAPPPVALGRRASLIVSAGVVAHTLWSSAAPAMAYRLYADQWHLNHTVTTEIFAIYPVIVVLTLIGFGDIATLALASAIPASACRPLHLAPGRACSNS